MGRAILAWESRRYTWVMTSSSPGGSWAIVSWIAALSILLSLAPLPPWPYQGTEAVGPSPLNETEAAAAALRARRMLRAGQDMVSAAGSSAGRTHWSWIERRLVQSGWVVVHQPFTDDARPRPRERTSLLALPPGTPPARVVAVNVAPPEPMGLVTVAAALAAATAQPPTKTSLPVAWWFADARDRRDLGLRRWPEALLAPGHAPELWIFDASAGWPGTPLGISARPRDGLEPVAPPEGWRLTLARADGIVGSQPFVSRLVSAWFPGVNILDTLPAGTYTRAYEVAQLGPPSSEVIEEVLLSPALEARAALLGPAMAWLGSRPTLAAAPPAGHDRLRLFLGALLPALLLLASLVRAASRRQRGGGRPVLLWLGGLGASLGLAGVWLILAAGRTDWTPEVGRAGPDWPLPDAWPLIGPVLLLLVAMIVLARTGRILASTRPAAGSSLPVLAGLCGFVGHAVLVWVSPVAAVLGSGPLVVAMASSLAPGRRRALAWAIGSILCFVVLFGRTQGLGRGAPLHVLNLWTGGHVDPRTTAALLLLATGVLGLALWPVRIGGRHQAAP